MDQVSGRIEDLLTLSMASGNELQIAHFMTTYYYAGTTYGQYNCNTCFEEHYQDSANDENGSEAAWEFDFLRRPSGALVPFHWTGNIAKPLNDCEYYIYKNGDTLRVKFNDDITQVFSDDILIKCEYSSSTEKKEMTLPGRGVTYTENGDSYTFQCVNIRELTELTIYDSAKAAPFVCHYIPRSLRTFGAQAFSLMSNTALDADVVTRVISSTDIADTAGYSFSAFFPGGGQPDFGTPDSCLVKDFFNQYETLMAKYIELRYGDNLMRGYWHKINTGLVPMELVVFERNSTNLDRFLETRTDIKFDSNNERYEAVSRSLKERFPFGEQTIAEYKYYGTEQQMESTY